MPNTAAETLASASFSSKPRFPASRPQHQPSVSGVGREHSAATPASFGVSAREGAVPVGAGARQRRSAVVTAFIPSIQYLRRHTSEEEFKVTTLPCTWLQQPQSNGYRLRQHAQPFEQPFSPLKGVFRASSSQRRLYSQSGFSRRRPARRPALLTRRGVWQAAAAG